MAIIKNITQREDLILRIAFIKADNSKIPFESIPLNIFKEAELKVNIYNGE